MGGGISPEMSPYFSYQVGAQTVLDLTQIFAAVSFDRAVSQRKEVDEQSLAYSFVRIFLHAPGMERAVFCTAATCPHSVPSTR